MGCYKRVKNLSMEKNKQAIQAANAAIAPKTRGRLLKPLPDQQDAQLREEWMKAYIAAGGEYEEVCPSGKEPSDDKQSCQNCNLEVNVSNSVNEKPIEGALVSIKGPEERTGTTDTSGKITFSNVTPGKYTIKASKDKHLPDSVSKTKPVPEETTTVVQLQLGPVVKKENIIFIGSELGYDSFWLKMMFIATGFAMGDRGIKLRLADKNTIVFVDVGYTKAEKLPLELLKRQSGFNIKSISSIDDIITYINNRGKETEKILIQDMAFFCHGLLGRLALNYKGLPSIDITVDNLSSIDMDVFLPNGRIYSYACRTGIAKLGRKFNSDEEADPKNSLAQKMADHFKVDVYAFLTRTYYGNVLREKSDSERISSALKKARQTRDGEIIDIPPEHEGLPHPGLYEGGWFSSTDEEGTDEYALWRKQGAIRMPSAGDTPKGLSKSMRRFTPT